MFKKGKERKVEKKPPVFFSPTPSSISVGIEITKLSSPALLDSMHPDEKAVMVELLQVAPREQRTMSVVKLENGHVFFLDAHLSANPPASIAKFSDLIHLSLEGPFTNLPLEILHLEKLRSLKVHKSLLQYIPAFIWCFKDLGSVTFNCDLDRASKIVIGWAKALSPSNPGISGPGLAFLLRHCHYEDTKEYDDRSWENSQWSEYDRVFEDLRRYREWQLDNLKNTDLNHLEESLIEAEQYKEALEVNTILLKKTIEKETEEAKTINPVYINSRIPEESTIRSWILMKMGNFQDAINIYAENPTILEKVGYYKIFLAAIHLERGDLDSSEQLIKSMPSKSIRAEHLYYLARIEEQRGNIQKAIEYYESFMQNYFFPSRVVYWSGVNRNVVMNDIARLKLQL